jgi:hypothetical protein
MEAYWGSDTHSLTSALDGGELSASRHGSFTPRKRAPGTHWIGGWVGSRAFLDAVVKRKIPSPRRESNPRTPIVQPVAQRYTDWAITAILRCVLEKYVTKLWTDGEPLDIAVLNVGVLDQLNTDCSRRIYRASWLLRYVRDSYLVTSYLDRGSSWSFSVSIATAGKQCMIAPSTCLPIQHSRPHTCVIGTIQPRRLKERC